jgi:cytidylate kinase
VIVSHAAGVPLAGRPDLLRVLITASFEPRAQRVAEATRSKKADAEQSVKDSDAGRADYFLRFYRIERELPTHYDLVVNTDALTAEEATDIVIAAAQRH